MVLGAEKTTHLLHSARVYAQKALKNETKPLPIYLSLEHYSGGNVDVLLSMIANSIGLESCIIRALWREKRRSLCLMLDNLDFIPPHLLPELISSLEGLYKAAPPNYHSLILASRPGLLVELIERCSIPFQGFFILPLSSSEIDDFLRNYGVSQLIEGLTPTLRDILHLPDVLSAYAQSVSTLANTPKPRNSGEICQLLVDRQIFGKNPGRYDYIRVKRPILAEIGYLILSQDHNYLVWNDDFEDLVAKNLESLEQRYQHRRRVMPDNWTAKDFLDELTESSVIQAYTMPDGEVVLSFSKSGFCDYLAAVNLSSFDSTDSEKRNLLLGLEPRKWFQPLLYLIGLKPDATDIFNTVFTSEPSLAVDLWHENRPFEVVVPNIIRTYYEDHIKYFTNMTLSNKNDPTETYNILRMVNSADPEQRFTAVSSMRQLGEYGLAPLLDGAEDDSALVRVVSQHSLLHWGETYFKNRSTAIPSLISIEDKRYNFIFNGMEGVNLTIGSLKLIEVPPYSTVDLSVSINMLDFDIFNANCTFELWYTFPELLAEPFFRNNQLGGWAGLAAMANWNAVTALEIARKAETRVGLSKLVLELQKKAAHYSYFSKLLANDLGLEWIPIEIPEEIMDWNQNYTEGSYKLLRDVLGRSNRNRTLSLDYQKGVIINVSQKGKMVSPGNNLLGVKVDKVMIAKNDKVDGDRNNKRFVDISQSIDCIEGFTSLMEIDEVHGATYPYPPGLIVDGALAVEFADGAEICGLKIGDCQVGLFGFLPKISITINLYENSHLYGIVVEHYPCKQSEGS